MKTYWHFAAMVGGRPVMRDDTPIEIGKRYTLPNATMCVVGYHGSPTALDALNYAPGCWVSKREILVTSRQHDKVVGTECVHTKGADATETLRKFARLCALDVIHLWDAPDVVVRYLKTGDESIRAAERAAARDAPTDAARDAVGAAAWAAAWDAAWDAARDAAWDAARAAARAAAWDAARDAPTAAAWDAPTAAAWAAVGAAVGAAQNQRLTRMLNALLRRDE